MAKKRYHVTEHGPYSVTLKESGIHLMPEVVTLQRAAIATTTRKLGGLMVATSAGKQYFVEGGISAAQRALTAEAFGVSL